ncbi:DUF5000 domain-containing lipoprotein [Abyssalbus ytuae]|uniref:DUF4959 domain-containing protein n=1 Tax=Abyssalbus ytuae TaxID=2926907 RepID=A0A9E7D2R5_9FLAO|nr:DUF5000 domain-containing lipoprotein [Abyssalbus ytuae]UOB18443.1 DUF4959 domain-containing protein [Abyssalbus ytuae]
MKNKLKLLVLPLAILILVFACEEHDHEPISSDDSKPTPPENIVVTPINGGFDISYDLPADNDLLFVKAVYTNSKGEEAEVKTSRYDNKIQILGLGDTSEKTITLYSGDRAENLSDPVTVKESPLTPPIYLIQETMEIAQDWGGAKFSWVNNLKTPVAIELLAEGNNSEIALVDTYYTESDSFSASIRGFEAVPTLFAAVIRDRYDNFSDTIYADTPDKLITPLHEERLDKTKFVKIVLDNDNDWGRWDNNYSNFYDDDIETVVHTQGGEPFPQTLSVDLGQNVILSRIVVNMRRGWPYDHGNPKKYNLYGAKEFPGTDGNFDNWTLLKECESIKPSGLPIGTNTDEDMAHFEAGDEYTFDEQTEIRYFRFSVTQTWDGATYVDFAEITFWGNVVD